MPGTRDLNIIIIEDNQDHARILKWAFDQHERRDRLTFFSDPHAALNYISSAVRESLFKPDLILLDLNLPKLDGREVLRTLKANDALKSIPVVVLSSSDREEDVQQAYLLGANTYVSKSFLLSQLTPALRTLLDYWSCLAQLPSRKPLP